MLVTYDIKTKKPKSHFSRGPFGYPDVLMEDEPQDINDRYHVLNGAIYGLASHGKVLGAFKPSNRSPDLKSLYFSGGSAHPGPGMPMVLMSGWIAADTLDKDGIAPSNGEKHGNKQALAHSNS